MLKIEWQDIWLNTLIDAGISRAIAKNAFLSTYGENEFDSKKNPAHAAHETLKKIKKDMDLKQGLQNRSPCFTMTNDNG